MKRNCSSANTHSAVLLLKNDTDKMGRAGNYWFAHRKLYLLINAETGQVKSCFQWTVT
jgi:hypothetical protein